MIWKEKAYIQNVVHIKKEIDMKKAIMIMVMFAMMATAGSYLTENTPSRTGLYIRSYFTLDNGGVILVLNKSIPKNSLGCDYTDKVYIPGNLAGSKNLIATAMAAYLNGKEIGMYASHADVIPHWGGTKTGAYVLRLWML